ncbi:T7SS effector LXG polymorphic toxin [Pseudogracilibacillus sp. SO30301A]|uniref:T7SS effector LXG polymorphic toxin n=1 Tax=Pseudogracilibacillus sp. SO30301A TaxID=3098291 RepID=UPI00300E0536
MGHKVYLAEVTAFSSKVNTSSQNVELSLDAVIDGVNKIQSMESFTGSAASSAKNYFGELHLSLADAFQVLFISLNKHLKEHIEKFQSGVDSSSEAIVQTDYLETIKQELDTEYKKLSGYQQGVSGIIDDISDIVSISTPSFYSVINDYRDTVKIIDELDKNLNSFTNKGKGHDNTIKEIMHHIEVIMKKANAATGEARFSDFKSGTANKDVLETKDLVSYISKMNTVLNGANDSLTEHAHYNQKGRYNTPKLDPHPSTQTASEKAKYVLKESGKGVKDRVKGMAGFGKGASKALGPASAGLSYYSNYHDAKAAGLKGKDAHVRATEDTVIDTAVSGAVQAGFTAAGTVLIPIPGVGTAAGVVAGMFVNVLLNVELGKTKKSVMDRVKGGFRKLKGWFS